jgi:hypothetical protein
MQSRVAPQIGQSCTRETKAESQTSFRVLSSSSDFELARQRDRSVLLDRRDLPGGGLCRYSEARDLGL